MFVNVKTFFLYSFIYAQAMDIFDAVEQNQAAACCPEVDDQNAKKLGTEETPAVTVESTVAGREQTCHQRT